MLNKPININLALQGGGSHGAFSWGVLKRLVKESHLNVEGISGTSSGAVNASLLAYGISQSRQQPCDALDYFWTELGKLFSKIFTPSNSFTKFPLLSTSDNSYALELFLNMSQSFSPYLFNPNDMNPFRELLKKSINFEVLRNSNEIKLFIAATNIKTSKLKIFNRNEITAEHILASACLPSLHHAITIDGETYWDGGFTGNPPLYPLIFNCESPDLLIVLLQPLVKESIPDTANKIRERMFEIAFHSNFMREMRAISFSKQFINQHYILKGALEKKLNNLRIHIIHADDNLKKMDHKSKYDASPDLIKRLHDAGYEAADKWLSENCLFIGRQSTTNLDVFSDYSPEEKSYYKLIS
jgi:NTE family protein